MSLPSAIANEWKKLSLWTEHLLDCASNGSTPVPMPNPPQIKGDGSNLPPLYVYGPPAPPPPPVPAEGYPELDEYGFYVAPGTKGTPVEGYRFMTSEEYNWPGLPEDLKNSINLNDQQNFSDTMTVDTGNRYDPAWFTEGINVFVEKNPVSQNWIKFTDRLVCPGAHKGRSAFTMDEFPAAIAYWTSTGVWPKIGHEEGNVAGP